VKVDALLCDHAQVHGGKLFVSGAGINLINVPTVQPPHPVAVWFAALLTVPWNATNQVHRVVISVVDADGASVPIAQHAPGSPIRDGEQGAIVAEFNVGRAPIMQAGESTLVPLAVPINYGLPNLGAFTISVTVDGKSLSETKFRLIPPQPAMGGSMGGYP
jgi:hypothetical protein